MRLPFATDVCLLESITRQLRELGTVVLSLCRATSGRLLRRGGEGRELPVEGDVVHIHALRELPHGSRRELPLDGVGGPLLGPVEVQDLLDDLGVIELPGRRSAWVRPGLPGRPELNSECGECNRTELRDGASLPSDSVHDISSKSE